jgi:hypothetical protein
VAVKAPGFGERKTSYLEDIAILTGGQLIKEELGITLDKAGEEVLGTAAKVVIGKVRGGGGDDVCARMCVRVCVCFGSVCQSVCASCFGMAAWRGKPTWWMGLWRRVLLTSRYHARRPASRCCRAAARQPLIRRARHRHPPRPPQESCTIVGDGSTQAEVSARVKQIRNLAEATEQDYEREKLNERIARLSGGVAIIQVRAVWRGPTCLDSTWPSHVPRVECVAAWSRAGAWTRRGSNA